MRSMRWRRRRGRGAMSATSPRRTRSPPPLRRSERDLGEPEVLVYNAGGGVFGDVEAITPGAVRDVVAGQRLWRPALRAGRDSGHEGGAARRDYLHRRHRFASRRPALGGFRAGQGGAARRSPDPWRAHCGRRASTSRWWWWTAWSIWERTRKTDAGQAGQLLHQARRRGGDGVSARRARTRAPGASRSRRGRSARRGEGSLVDVLEAAVAPLAIEHREIEAVAVAVDHPFAEVRGAPCRGARGASFLRQSAKSPYLIDSPNCALNSGCGRSWSGSW